MQSKTMERRPKKMSTKREQQHVTLPAKGLEGGIRLDWTTSIWEDEGLGDWWRACMQRERIQESNAHQDAGCLLVSFTTGAPVGKPRLRWKDGVAMSCHARGCTRASRWGPIRLWPTMLNG